MGERLVQYNLSFAEELPSPSAAPQNGVFSDTAFTKNRTEPLHRWVPWIAGFSAPFVAGVLEAAAAADPTDVTVLDPFAGVGTTLVEAVRRGHNAIGFEINPYAALVCRVKLKCFDYDVGLLERAIRDLEVHMAHRSRSRPASKPPLHFHTRSPFFSPAVERKVLRVLDYIAGLQEQWLKDIFRVALGAVMVSFSNYSYEPSLGRRSSAGKSEIEDADVGGILAAKLTQMLTDIALWQLHVATLPKRPSAELHARSFLTDDRLVPDASVDFLITSPPYLNNYHYIRNTRPQLYWLGLVERPADLKEMERLNFGKFWQTVRAGPTIKLEFECPELARELKALRARNPERGVYGGRGWANYAAAYFNDCFRFCRAARRVMRRGGTVVIVIGNSILQGIEFKTERHLAQIAENCGFQLVGLHRVRTKRTGSSIVNSSVRAGTTKEKVELYECALELKA